MLVIKRKLHTLLHTPRIFMKKFAGTKLFRLLPDKLALKIQYKNVFLESLDLKNPQSFNEKLQWLKLYNRKPEYTAMVDKYEAKKIAADMMGYDHIIPSYGVWNSFDEINFDELPDQFVLKCTHGSGDVVIVKDKKTLDINDARNKITRSLRKNYYKIAREWPYKNVTPRVIAEKYMHDDSGELKDYKIYCFDGQAKMMMISSNRFSAEQTRFDFFDEEFNWLDIIWGNPKSDTKPQKPEAFEEMMMWASKMSSGIPQVRMDFYAIDGKVYFGEFTFFDGAGFEQITPRQWGERLGSWIQLPEKTK